MPDYFLPGEWLGHLPSIEAARPIADEVCARVPARLNAMCFDQRSLTNPREKGIYTAGELALSVASYSYARVRRMDGRPGAVHVPSHLPRRAIVRHAALLVQQAVGSRVAIEVIAFNEHPYPHAGLGSSSALMTVTAMAMNEMFGRPLSRAQLKRLLIQNHGEEAANDDSRLVRVQCNGGAPAVALDGGGMIILAGEGVVVARYPYPPGMRFVLGIPNFYASRDAATLMALEETAFGSMHEHGVVHAGDLAWRVLHELLPALATGDVRTLGRLLVHYRFDTGSLAIDARYWPGLLDLMNALRKEYEEGALETLSISSCGPAVFSLTHDPQGTRTIFQAHGLACHVLAADEQGGEFITAIPERGSMISAAADCQAKEAQ